MLVLSRKIGTQLIIGTGPNAVTVEVLRIQGGQVKLGVAAPLEVLVRRGELPPKVESAEGSDS